MLSCAISTAAFNHRGVNVLICVLQQRRYAAGLYRWRTTYNV